MNSSRKAIAILCALGLSMASAQAQTTPVPDPHHPDNPAGSASPAPGQPAAPSAASGAAATPQMGMMMGDMRQMMGMMQQMMQMMGRNVGQAVDPATGSGPMMGGMPMMGMGSGGPGSMAGQPGSAAMPGMFRHTEGILAFYKAELRITEAQASAWNGFADAVRAGAKAMREGMQRAGAQRGPGTAPEQMERRVALLTANLDAAKSVSAAAKTLYAALNADQRKLADEFMIEHMRGMRGMIP